MRVRRSSMSGVAKGLGWLGIGLGLAELLAGRELARSLGLEHRTGLVRLAGARGIMNGIGMVVSPSRSRRMKRWLWARVAGDILDLSVLSAGLSQRNRRRDNAGLAAAGVFGITLLDVASGALTNEV